MSTWVFALQEVNTDGKKEPSVEKKQVQEIKDKPEAKDKPEVKKKSAAEGAFPDTEVKCVPELFCILF